MRSRSRSRTIVTSKMFGKTWSSNSMITSSTCDLDKKPDESMKQKNLYWQYCSRLVCNCLRTCLCDNYHSQYIYYALPLDTNCERETKILQSGNAMMVRILMNLQISFQYESSNNNNTRTPMSFRNNRITIDTNNHRWQHLPIFGYKFLGPNKVSPIIHRKRHMLEMFALKYLNFFKNAKVIQLSSVKVFILRSIWSDFILCITHANETASESESISSDLRKPRRKATKKEMKTRNTQYARKIITKLNSQREEIDGKLNYDKIVSSTRVFAVSCENGQFQNSANLEINANTIWLYDECGKHLGLYLLTLVYEHHSAPHFSMFIRAYWNDKFFIDDKHIKLRIEFIHKYQNIVARN